jgi:hypothetical protein
MRNLARLSAVLALVVVAASGCMTASYPAQLLLEPPRFENDSVRIEWVIGATFYRLKITNLTTEQMDLDLAGSAIVSVDGESRPLALVGRKDSQMIPPKAYVVLASEQGVVYGTDILGRFNSESEEKYPMPPGNPGAEDRTYLKTHSGETLRLYLSADVRGKKVTFDVPFRITGATRVMQSSTDQPTPAAAPAAAPAPAPAPAPSPAAPAAAPAAPPAKK